MQLPYPGDKHEISLAVSNHDETDTVVIVGGGSIGLTTAYNLARTASHSSRSRTIIIIDPFDQPFAASSTNCTGCLHYGFPEEQSKPLLPLGRYSFDLWEDEAESDDFRRTTGYRPHSFFGVKRGSGHGVNALPDWIEKDPTWDIDEDISGRRNATVNPAGIGEWLTTHCRRLGVEIDTQLRAISASLSQKNEIQEVVCLNKDLIPVRLRCTKLLLACGPWTPTVYKTLFPSSPIRLHASTDAGDWILCRNPCPTTETTVAYVSFAAIVGDKMEFAARNNGTIWACGRRNLTATLPPPGETARPDDDVIEELLGDARARLSSKCTCVKKHDEELQLVSKGRAFRPATISGLPTISAVDPCDLRPADNDLNHMPGSLNGSSGVFVCWGHGSYGLTLGMGSGKLMSQLISGETPDLDLSPFTLRRDDEV